MRATHSPYYYYNCTYYTPCVARVRVCINLIARARGEQLELPSTYTRNLADLEDPETRRDYTFSPFAYII